MGDNDQPETENVGLDRLERSIMEVLQNQKQRQSPPPPPNNSIGSFTLITQRIVCQESK